MYVYTTMSYYFIFLYFALALCYVFASTPTHFASHPIYLLHTILHIPHICALLKHMIVRVLCVIILYLLCFLILWVHCVYIIHLVCDPILLNIMLLFYGSFIINIVMPSWHQNYIHTIVLVYCSPNQFIQ